MTPSNETISRVTRSHQEARASYNRMARWYDALSDSSERPLREIGLRMLAPAEGERLLEIGFGTGNGVLALAREAGETGRVFGVDLSDAMAGIARKRLEDGGISARTALQCGDALRLPYAARSFDAIFLSFTLELFDTPEIPRVLEECRRVLRESGRLCVVSMIREYPPNAMTRLYEWSHRLLPTYVDCRPIRLLESLAGAGFTIRASTRKSMWGLPAQIALAVPTSGRPIPSSV